MYPLLLSNFEVENSTMKKSVLLRLTNALILGLLVTSCAYEEARDKTFETPPPTGEEIPLDINIQPWVMDHDSSLDAASLLLDTMMVSLDTAGNAMTTLVFNVENYTLGMPSHHSDSMHLANSSGGQHIHLIIEDKPYEAHYTSTITVEGDLTSKVFLAFLSRSYHLSLKHEAAHYLHIPDNRSDINPISPMLFASRPKGAYKGQDAESVLLDFYLINANMPKSGYEVVVKINGESMGRLSEWTPYVMTGLSAGDYVLDLKLQGKTGEKLDGMYTTASQNFSIQ